MKTKDIIGTVVIAAVMLSIGICIGLNNSCKLPKTTKPIESYLVQVVDDPNWIVNYGVDLESRLVYNVALLNQIVNRQGNALKMLLRDPNR